MVDSQSLDAGDELAYRARRHMVDRQKIETVLHRRFPGADWTQIAAATNAIMGLTDEREGVQRADLRGTKTMTHHEQTAHAIEDPQGQLENALIDDFLRSKNLDSQTLRTLSDDEAKRVMTDASAYASAKLAEVESRAHFVHEIHTKE